MWLGPVFQAELVTSARRPRFFVGRVLYGLAVLSIVTSVYRSMASAYISKETEIPINALAEFGQAIFSAFATLQAAIIMVMTPALVAGAITDEKQRKTLHYLMASELTSTEIVVGKVAARLLRLAILGAIGLPVLSLVALFGGVDFGVVCMVYAATASTTFFIASGSMLCSVYAIKPRDAIVRAFFFEILWLSVPPITLSSMADWTPFWLKIGEFFRPALEWVSASSPSDLLRGVRMIPSLNLMLPKVCWMMGLQLVYGAIFLFIAAWRLRPNFRGQDGPKLWARLFGPKQVRSRWRLWPRPGCGDDAMLWKEMHVHRASNFRRLVYLSLTVTAVGLTTYAAWDIVWGAIHEALNDGYWNYGPNQQGVNALLRGANAVAMVVILLGMAAVAASSVTSEREGDTWVNLTSAPLSGAEIVRGKIVGSLWVFRSVAYLLGLCWAFGLLVGSVHPLGILACLIELTVFTWFIAALGVAISLRSKNTIQAMTLTLGILLFANVGYLFIFALLQSTGRTGMTIVVGCMPFLFSTALVGIDDLKQNSEVFRDLFTASLMGTFLYASAATYLTFRSITSYDSMVDRPDRRRNELTPEILKKIRESTSSG